jgi:hypothetical protein
MLVLESKTTLYGMSVIRKALAELNLDFKLQQDGVDYSNSSQKAKGLVLY